MICHQGSARASQRLRQGSLQQPKVSPAPAKPTHFIQPIHPHKPWGTMAHPTPQGPCLPPAPEQAPPRQAGTAAHLPSPPPAGWITQARAIRKTLSIPPHPAASSGSCLGSQKEPKDSLSSNEPQHPQEQHKAPALFAKRFWSQATKAC